MSDLTPIGNPVAKRAQWKPRPEPARTSTKEPLTNADIALVEFCQADEMRTVQYAEYLGRVNDFTIHYEPELGGEG